MSFESILQPSRKLIFVGGKGGVGKSTSASAIGLHLSRHFKTLIISTDPAHSMGDSWQQQVSSTPTSLGWNEQQLDVMELDARTAFDAFKQQHEEEIRLLFDTSTYFDKNDIDQVMSLVIPGIDEVMGLKSIIDTLQEDTYEKIVIDTAPTGHALRLLFMPDTLNEWIKTMASMRWKYRVIQKTFKGKYSPDEADDMLLDLKRMVSRMKSVLSDATLCEFVLVTIPNEMAYAETLRLYEELAKSKVFMKNVIINYTAPDSTDPFYHKIYERQLVLIQKIEKQFSEFNLLEVPLFAEEIHGKEALTRFERVLFNLN